MKLINTMLIGATIFAFSSCGVGSPESVGEKAAEMEKEYTMQKYDNREENVNKKAEIEKFRIEILKKYGKDEAAMKAVEDAYEKKSDELKIEYNKHETEIERKYEDKATELKRKTEEIGQKAGF